MMLFTGLSRSLRLYTVLIAVIFCGTVYADTHVLVRFDETGHYLHRVARTQANSVTLALSSTRSLSNSSAAEVQVRWYDQSGKLIGSTSLTDPRLTHAPLLQGSTDLAWTSHQEGAYSLTGPSDTAKIQVILPGWTTPYLPAQTWVLEL